LIIPCFFGLLDKKQNSAMRYSEQQLSKLHYSRQILAFVNKMLATTSADRLCLIPIKNPWVFTPQGLKSYHQ